MATLLTTLFLASAVKAKVLPRNAEVDAKTTPAAPLVSIAFPSTSFFDEPSLPSFTDIPTLTFTDIPTPSTTLSDGTQTLTIPLPTQAFYTTITVPACTLANGKPVPAFVVVGVPTGTFAPGTKTIVAPPQADPTTVSFYDFVSNETETIVVKPLAGTCGEIDFLPPPSDPFTEEPNPATPSGCPTKGCTGAVIKAAETVITAVNKVTLLSQQLQDAAKKIGTVTIGGGDVNAAQGPITDVATGLARITESLVSSAPRFLFLPPFAESCSADTIVIAWIEFVRVHQELLGILIGQAGLLEKGPVKRSEGDEGVQAGFIGRPIALALRALEVQVDTVALKIVELVPGKSACSEEKADELRESIREAEESYEG